MRSIFPANFSSNDPITSRLSPQMSLLLQPPSRVSPCWPSSRVDRLSLMVSSTWKGRLTRGTSLRVPCSLYLPGQTSSVLVMSIFATKLSSPTADSRRFFHATPHSPTPPPSGGRLGGGHSADGLARQGPPRPELPPSSPPAGGREEYA